MRSTKFRGKRKDNGEWVVGDVHWNKDCTQCHIHERGQRIKSYDVIPETVGEWTGRKDRNNKDIYEDDEVNFIGNKHRSYTCGLPETCRVVWSEEASGWMLVSEKHSFGLYKMGIHEVIGNIPRESRAFKNRRTK
jgi:hypothetical protein